MEGYPDERRAPTAHASNVTPTAHEIASEDRAIRNGQRRGVPWFTGLSGGGKSTLVTRMAGYAAMHSTLTTSGFGLNANLGFSPEDRMENIRRVGEMAAMFADAGWFAITSFISPYQTDRDRARAAIRQSRFGGLRTTRSNGLYEWARRARFPFYWHPPYEPPSIPKLTVETEMDIEACIAKIVDYVERHFRLPDLCPV
jgi:bifunctional enzyme CysN/CysC